MSLLQQIKADSLEARKARLPHATFLVTLLGEASRPGLDDGKRESTDAEVAKVVKKFTDGAKELLAAVEQIEDAEKIAACKMELDQLAKYTPLQMSEEELRSAINQFLVGAPGSHSVGSIMGFLKNAYAGKYDGSLASKLAKDMVS